MSKDSKTQRPSTTFESLPEQSKARVHVLDLTGVARAKENFPNQLELVPAAFSLTKEEKGSKQISSTSTLKIEPRQIESIDNPQKSDPKPQSEEVNKLEVSTSPSKLDSAKKQEPPIEAVTPKDISRGQTGWAPFRVQQLIDDGQISLSWLPDIQAAAPTHLQIQNEHQREMLRFSNSIVNTGANNLQVRRGIQLDPNDPDQQDLVDYGVSFGLDPNETAITSQELLDENGQIAAIIGDAALSEFHPTHKHFHIGETAGFSLEQQDDERGWDPITGYEVTKTTFCLIDVNRIEQVQGDQWEIVNSPAKDNLYNDCFADVQGIQDGWIDRYSHSLPGQEVDITDLEAGIYRIKVVVNPSNWFIESNFDNNVGWTAFELSRDSNGNASLHELTGIGMVGGIWFDQSPNGMG